MISFPDDGLGSFHGFVILRISLDTFAADDMPQVQNLLLTKEPL